MDPARTVRILAQIRAGVPSNTEEHEALTAAIGLLRARNHDYRLCRCGHYGHQHTANHEACNVMHCDCLRMVPA